MSCEKYIECFRQCVRACMCDYDYDSYWAPKCMVRCDSLCEPARVEIERAIIRELFGI